MIAHQGHTYIGGADVPIVVSNAKIAEWLTAHGFSGVLVVSRDKFPIKDLPLIPAGTEDDWDTVAVATRVAPTGDVSVPSRVRWIVDVTPVQMMPTFPQGPVVVEAPPTQQPSMPPQPEQQQPAPAQPGATATEARDVALGGAALGVAGGVIALAIAGKLGK